MINIDGNQITAKCTKRLHPAFATITIDDFQLDIAEGESIPFSYEAALLIWDCSRIKKNKITLYTSEHGRWFVLMLSVALLSIMGMQGKNTYEVSHGYKRHKFMFELDEIIDPYIFQYRQNAKELIADILDDFINRPESLKQHDTENFKWHGKQIQFLKR